VFNKEQQSAWQSITTQELYLWLTIQIQVSCIGVSLELYWIKDGVYLPKDISPPAPDFGKTYFQKICCFLYVFWYNSPTETPED